MNRGAPPPSYRSGPPRPPPLGPPRARIDRDKTTPSLLRLFVRLNGHHHEGDFSHLQQPTRDEYQVFVWRDSTVSEILLSLRDVAPSFRTSPLALYTLRLIYFDPQLGPSGRYTSRELASVTAKDLLRGGGGPGGRRSLQDVRFVVGDWVDVAYYPGGSSGAMMGMGLGMAGAPSSSNGFGPGPGARLLPPHVGGGGGGGGPGAAQQAWGQAPNPGGMGRGDGRSREGGIGFGGGGAPRGPRDGGWGNRGGGGGGPPPPPRERFDRDTRDDGRAPPPHMPDLRQQQQQRRPRDSRSRSPVRRPLRSRSRSPPPPPRG